MKRSLRIIFAQSAIREHFIVSITYLEAIREAQAHALRDDPRVFIYGQDVGAFGGAFKATKNLAREFPGRVLDSPISEDAMVGHGRRRGHRRHAADYRDAVCRFFHSLVSTKSSIRRRRFFGARMFPAPSPCACPLAAPPAAGLFTANVWKPFMPIIPA